MQYVPYRQLQCLGKLIKTAGVVSNKQLRHQNFNMRTVGGKEKKAVSNEEKQIYTGELTTTYMFKSSLGSNKTTQILSA